MLGKTRDWCLLLADVGYTLSSSNNKNKALTITFKMNSTVLKGKKKRNNAAKTPNVLCLIIYHKQETNIISSLWIHDVMKKLKIITLENTKQMLNSCGICGPFARLVKASYELRVTSFIYEIMSVSDKTSTLQVSVKNSERKIVGIQLLSDKNIKIQFRNTGRKQRWLGLPVWTAVIFCGWDVEEMSEDSVRLPASLCRSLCLMKKERYIKKD